MCKLNLVTFIGPSAVGKSTLSKELGLPQFVTLTTREPRKGEQDGVDYKFIGKEDFLNRRERGQLVEDVEYAGNYYGTDLSDLAMLSKSGRLHTFVATYEGFKCLSAYVNAISIFLWAPKDVIERRLRARGDDPGTIEKRLALYDDQMETAQLCDYRVPNWEYNFRLALILVKEILDKYGCQC